MATYGRRHQILISDTIEILKDQLVRDVFDGIWEPTGIKVFGTGTLNEFTEEVTYTSANTYYNVSGIISEIKVGDELLGVGGRVKVGDTSVLYPYDAVSGLYLGSLIQEIMINIPGVSGLFSVTGRTITTIAGEPVLIKFGLAQDHRV